MGFVEGKIRPLAIAVIENGGKFLVVEGYDKAKDEKFYRAIGGGIDFGERSDQALNREIFEETGSELENIKFLGVLENVFSYQGTMGHEILFIYRADFKDKNLYQGNIEILDKLGHFAQWVTIEELNEKGCYPEGIKRYLTVVGK